MKFESIACLSGLAWLMIVVTTVPCTGHARDALTPDPSAANEKGEKGSSLDAAFHGCVSLYGHPLAGALMRTISDRAARAAFEQAHSAAVRSFSIEREHGYATATAQLREGIAVAGVPARAIYASTCELECPLSVWGLEFGKVTEQQLMALKAWVESAPSTPTDTHGDIKVQLSATPEGETILVCDVSD